MPRRLCLVVLSAAVVQGLVFPVRAPPRTARNTLRRAEDEKSDERNERLAPVEETLSAFVVGAVAAAGAGVEILDAGAVSSALLAGALVGFAAENENQYGFGMLARGLGKVGYSAFKAATEEKPPAEEPDLLKPADFEKRLRDVRAARESDLREVSSVESKEDSLSELGADLSSKV
jgi:hypothetical protein